MGRHRVDHALDMLFGYLDRLRGPACPVKMLESRDIFAESILDNRTRKRAYLGTRESVGCSLEHPSDNIAHNPVVPLHWGIEHAQAKGLSSH